MVLGGQSIQRGHRSSETLPIPHSMPISYLLFFEYILCKNPKMVSAVPSWVPCAIPGNYPTWGGSLRPWECYFLAHEVLHRPYLTGFSYPLKEISIGLSHLWMRKLRQIQSITRWWITVSTLTWVPHGCLPYIEGTVCIQHYTKKEVI